MEEQYYVRRKGRVAGPYDFEVIMKMAKTGKLFKSDYVSLDQVSWSLAEDCDIIFPKPPKPPIDPPYVDPSPDPTGGPPVGVPSTNKDWHYSYGDISYGPIKETELKQKFLTKEITTKTKVWTDGMADWEAADQVKTFIEFFKAIRPGIAGQFDPIDDRLYATFMQRVGAEIIDGMVGCTISIVVYFASTFFVGLFLGFLITVLGRNVDNFINEITLAGVLIGAILTFVSVMLYYIKPIASRNMATVGKSAMGIYVCKLDGSQLSFGVAFLRYLTKTITYGLFLGLGCLTVLFTVKKQALHDLMIESIVLQRVE
jgi:uncharacterized RDD family membrane protein YckC